MADETDLSAEQNEKEKKTWLSVTYENKSRAVDHKTPAQKRTDKTDCFR